MTQVVLIQVKTPPEYIQSNGVTAEIVRTSRIKTATIKVEDGMVSVVVPQELAATRIKKLIAEKRHWINQKIFLHKTVAPVNPKQFVSGESFPYLGHNYRLKVKRGSYQPVKLIQGQLLMTLPDGAKNAAMVRSELIRWYKQRAEIKLLEKTERYAKIVQVKPESVGVRHFKNKWGSCSAKGRIDFNWHIVMAPNRIVDYVVAHELCHLKQHDHSPKFWKIVERIFPDYLDSKEWLKVNGGGLSI